MRYSDWNQKNRELYEGTVNRANNTCTLNKYRTVYLQALHKKNMENDTIQIGDKVRYKDLKDEYVVCGLSTMVYDNDCEGEPEWKVTQKIQEVAIQTPYDHITYQKPAWVNITNVSLLSPCGKPHNNGEDTCNECLAIKENS